MGQGASVSHKKLALVLSGAVSLGTYEAGVIFELLYAKEDQAKSGRDDFGIDVVVGASAGAITGALLSYILVAGADKAILHQVWVKDFDFHRFKKRGSDSLVDGNQIGEILRKVIKESRTSPGRYGQQEELLLVFALTNLDGLKYLIAPSSGGKPIVTYSFADKLKLTLRPGGKAEAPWEKIIEGAQASSAFPVVFNPVYLKRDALDYQEPVPEPPLEFTYSDGGMIDNRPLGLAIEGALMKKPKLGEERFFVLIEPDPPEKHFKLKEEYNMFDSAVAALWTIPRYDSLHKELIHVLKINQRIHWLNDTLNWISPWLKQHFNQLEAREFINFLKGLQEECRKIAREFVAQEAVQERSNTDKRAEVYFKGELSRIALLKGLPIPREEEPDSLFNQKDVDQYEVVAPFLVFLLEHLSGLSRKEELKVEQISPASPKEELAGEFWGHFGGAFDERIREHDFRLGRLSGRRWLESKGIIYTADSEDSYGINPELGSVSWRDLPVTTKFETVIFMIKAVFRLFASMREAFVRK